MIQRYNKKISVPDEDLSLRPLRLKTVASCRSCFLHRDPVIQLNVIVRHAMRIEALARPLKSAIRKAALQLQIATENAHRLG